MTSFIAAGGSGRSTSVIPAVPAASSVTTIAFIRDLPLSSSLPTRTGAADCWNALRRGDGHTDSSSGRHALKVFVAGADAWADRRLVCHGRSAVAFAGWRDLLPK